MIHSGAGPATFDDPARLADAIVEKVGKTIVLALPLGLGKATHIVNALYANAATDRSLRLTIFTALTLEAPRAKNELERRFLEPIAQRAHFPRSSPWRFDASGPIRGYWVRPPRHIDHDSSGRPQVMRCHAGLVEVAVYETPMPKA
jgi:hypothetical protein